MGLEHAPRVQNHDHHESRAILEHEACVDTARSDQPALLRVAELGDELGGGGVAIDTKELPLHVEHYGHALPPQGGDIGREESTMLCRPMLHSSSLQKRSSHP